MTKIIVFTDKEIEDLTNNKEVWFRDRDGVKTVYMSREAYSEFVVKQYRFGLDAE